LSVLLLFGNLITTLAKAMSCLTYRRAGHRPRCDCIDANSQLTKLVNEHDEVTSYSYDPVGREILKELDNGTRATLIYDVAGQILSVANLDDNDGTISQFQYSYDPVGNRLQETREDSDTRVFVYDPTNQLISEQRTEGESWSTLTGDQWGDLGVDDWGLLPVNNAVSGPITTYVYDPVGNRLVLNVDGELTTSTYDHANRLINAEDVNGITTYTFDPNGNQRTIETPNNEVTTYSWSYENQLIQIEAPDDEITTQVYAPVTRNSDELRLSKESDIGITNFIWDNQNIIREVDELNVTEAEYTLNPQPYGNLVSQRREDESTFYNFDALGSTESLTDAGATQTDQYTYSAFGKITSQSGATDNTFTWIGELGYYQNPDGSFTLRRRDYTTQEARFRSEDPLGINGGDTNLYSYVGNSPTNMVDPSGLGGVIQFGNGVLPGVVNFTWSTPAGWNSVTNYVYVGDIDAYSCVTRDVIVWPSRQAEFNGKPRVRCKVHYNELVDWANAGLIPLDHANATEVIDNLFLDRCKQNQGSGCTRNPLPPPSPPPTPAESPFPEGATCSLPVHLPFPALPDLTPDPRDLHDQLLDCPRGTLTPGCFPRMMSKSDRKAVLDGMDVGKTIYSAAVSAMPGIGDLKDLLEAWQARDLITGEEFGRLETAIVRAFAFMPFVPNSALVKISQYCIKLLKLLSSKLKGCPRGEKLGKWLDDIVEWLEKKKGKGSDNGPNPKDPDIILKSFDDIVKNPASLWGMSPEKVAAILGPGWTRDVYARTGSGWRFTKGDKTVFYHVGGLHKGQYWGYTSGVTGKVKIVGCDYVATPGDKATILHISTIIPD